MGGFAASRVLEVHGERMLTGNYKPGFKARLYKKDLRVVQETMAAHGVPALASALVQQLVHAQLAAGGGEDDYSAIATVVFGLAGLD
jgi:2-hydroxy-3-oxopropionate reductase